MNNRFAIFSLLISSAIVVNGCSNDGPFDDPNAIGINEITPVPDTITQIADQNSFSISREKTAVEGLNLEGVTSDITARVADRHNNPVPDNTAIKFLTNGGRIEPQCLTANGECTVTWTEQLPTPSSSKAIIIAYTSGEESFTDLNDNDQYDAGETFTDNSEPFFDSNEDGIRNTNEEFVDANSDNIFDAADGLFTGVPCVGDNTVCDRVTTLVWDSTDILVSGSYANISISSGALPGAIDSSTTITITIGDLQNGNPMADGTTVTLESSEGTVDPTDWAFAPRDSTINVLYTTGSTAGIQESFKVIVTSPSGAVTQRLFFTNTLL